jgi:hypothetical protein
MIPERSRATLVSLAALAAVAVLAATVTGFAAAAIAPSEGAGTAPAHDASIEIQYEGENLTLPPTADATVRANTSLDPGTELTFRVESKGEPSFTANATTTVAEDGTATWTLDLSAGEAGQGFQIDVFIEDEDRPSLGMGGAFADSANATESDDATSSTTTDGTETPGQPGFGTGVAVVAVAFALALAVAARRR